MYRCLQMLHLAISELTLDLYIFFLGLQTSPNQWSAYLYFSGHFLNVFKFSAIAFLSIVINMAASRARSHEWNRSICFNYNCYIFMSDEMNTLLFSVYNFYFVLYTEVSSDHSPRRRSISGLGSSEKNISVDGSISSPFRVPVSNTISHFNQKCTRPEWFPILWAGKLFYLYGEDAVLVICCSFSIHRIHNCILLF